MSPQERLIGTIHRSVWLVLWLTGEVEFETSDGDIRRLAAGSVLLAEDTAGKGHISRHSPEGQLVVHIAVDNTAALYPARQ
jgi:hypothetical protein